MVMSKYNVEPFTGRIDDDIFERIMKEYLRKTKDSPDDAEAASEFRGEIREYLKRSEYITLFDSSDISGEYRPWTFPLSGGSGMRGMCILSCTKSLKAIIEDLMKKGVSVRHLEAVKINYEMLISMLKDPELKLAGYVLDPCSYYIYLDKIDLIKQNMYNEFFDGVLEDPGFEELVVPHEEKRQEEPLKFDWKEEEQYEIRLKDLLYTSQYLIPCEGVEGHPSIVIGKDPTAGTGFLVVYVSTSSFLQFVQKMEEELVQAPSDDTKYYRPTAENAKFILADFEGLLAFLRDDRFPADSVAICFGNQNLFYTKEELEQLYAEKNK